MVRILAFTDPHGEKKALREILALAECGKPDLVVCAGDVSFFGRDCDTFLRDLGVLPELAGRTHGGAKFR